MNSICIGSIGRNGRKTEATAALNMFPKFERARIFEYLLTFNCRYDDKSIWRLGWRGIIENRGLFLAVIASLGLQFIIIYVPFFNAAFHTVPLTLRDWILVLIGGGAGALVLPELFMKPTKYFTEAEQSENA